MGEWWVWEGREGWRERVVWLLFYWSDLAQIWCQSGKLSVQECYSKLSEHSALINLFPSCPALSCPLVLTYAHTLLLSTYSFIPVRQCEECRTIAVWDPCRAVPAVQQDSGGAEEEGDTGCSRPSTSEESAVINQGAPTLNNTHKETHKHRHSSKYSNPHNTFPPSPNARILL